MPGELWLVRHGETEWSKAGKHTGSTDIPLTPAGEAAARAAGKRLVSVDFTRVLVSPLLRARQTCDLAGFGERAEITDDLHEWRYGKDEGRTTAEIRKERPGWTVWKEGPEGGERFEDVVRRVDRFIGLVRAAEGRVLAFAHGHISRVIGARWIDKEVADGARLRLDTAAISVLGYEREAPAIRLWNDTGKLPA